MRIIPTFVHGVIDYVGALAFFFAPEIFGFSDAGGWAVAIPRILGLLSVIYSLGTDYELGVVKAISMRAHLRIDYLVALIFLASPFACGFISGPPRLWLPHIVAASFVLVVTSATKTQPSHGAAL